MGANWWVAEAWEQSPVLLVSWVVWVIGSIILHELSHGWAAIGLGDRTPIETGHMTWNPLVHMGQMSLIMFALVGIAWGQMPVDRSRLRGRYADTLVSAAGPAMNLVLFAVAVVGSAAVLIFAKRLGEPLAPNLYIFFSIGAMLNMALCVFNLLPVPPLDGSRILADVAPAYARLWQGPQAQFAAMIAFIAVFFFAGDFVFGVAGEATGRALDLVMRAMGHAPLR